jgi:iron complex outermembrane receptor protein
LRGAKVVGAFEIRNVERGIYTLVASFVGLQAKEQQVEVTSGETVTVPEIFLSESAYELNEVVVSDFKSNPFGRKQSEFVAKLPLKNIENPQVYNTISAGIAEGSGRDQF